MLVAIALAIAMVGAWAFIRTRLPAMVAKSSDPSSSAPPASVPAYQRPRPTSPNPDAAAWFLKAHRKLRDGVTTEGWGDLENASKADPSFAAPFVLMLTFTGWDNPRAAFQSAYALRDGLDERDRGVVRVFEMVYGVAPDFAIAEQRARDLEASYPRDAELLLVEAQARARDPTDDDPQAYADAN